jgi:hypothetical protein
MAMFGLAQDSLSTISLIALTNVSDGVFRKGLMAATTQILVILYVKGEVLS